MCGIPGIEAFLLQSQFRSVGHIVRMPDFRIPKQAFFGQLASWCRLQGGSVRRYKDSLKINLRACDLAPSVLQTAPLDRSVWRQCCSNAISAFEERRTAALVAKWKAMQEGPCCCKRDDDVDLRRLRQTMRFGHWSVCPSQVAPMTWGSVDLDDSVHRVTSNTFSLTSTLFNARVFTVLLGTCESAVCVRIEYESNRE